MSKEIPGQFKIEFPSEDEGNIERVDNKNKNKIDNNVEDGNDDSVSKDKKEKSDQVSNKGKEDQNGERGNKNMKVEYNQPDEPDYHMGHWIKKQQENIAKKKRRNKKDSRENRIRQEIPREIWEELNSIGKVIQNRIMFLSGTNDVYKAGSHTWIKESAQRLRNSNNREDANELLNLRGALTRARYCRRLLQEGRLEEFISYIKKLPKEKGSSCSIILDLNQYDRLLKIIKNIE